MILSSIIKKFIEFNKQHNNRLLLVNLLIIYTLSTIWMLGYHIEFDRALLLLLFMMFFFKYKPIKIATVIFAIMTLCYFPAGLFYGHPSLSIIAAIVETNHSEAAEFFLDIPWWIYLGSLLYLLLILTLYRLHYQPFRVTPVVLLLLLLIAVVVPLKSVIRVWTGQENQQLTLLYLLKNIRILPLEFPIHSYIALQDYWQERSQLEQQRKIPPTWQIITSQPKYKNYVVVLGESARKDYMQSYGFSLPDTPFMQQTAGLLWDGLIAPGPNTQASVMRLLSINHDDKVEINNNILSLANKAGFDTYWFSNQGQLGSHDTAVTRVALYAKQHFFTMAGEYNGKKEGVADEALLNPLAAALRTPAQRPRLFILHIMGSHPDFCQRVKQRPTLYYVNKSLTCYVTTIQQTDLLLSKIYQLLQQAADGNSFSLLYLADHGLGHTAGEITLRHNANVKQAYQIPLFMTSSDSQQQEKIVRLRSGFHFINALAEWLSITAGQLNNGYHFFAAGDDADVRVLGGTLFDQLQDDLLPDHAKPPAPGHRLAATPRPE